MIGSFPDGTRGFDANRPLRSFDARAFRAAGYRFAIRYLRRADPHSYDLTADEIAVLHACDLAIGLVQHVSPPGWHPTAALGDSYGITAALEARRLGVPAGVVVWCDLEGVAAGVPRADVIAFCNQWHDRVAAAGYLPGLYVGDSCGLSAMDLYRALKFKRYWRAYNLNDDRVPAVRGVQMSQWAVTPTTRLPGIPFEWDGDTIRADQMGGSPTFWLP